jgi:hypothetical protein
MLALQVLFGLEYTKKAYIKHNETQELLEPLSSSDPHTHEDSSPN